ncbi:MAG: SRPBCC domain-containing protein [Bacteroidetes bacterium]|nr:SRPBCC domain-containing protein [Bacteroidota bacterium]
METKDITHEVEFSASPTQVYEALMNAEIHGDITGANADIADKEGYSFSIYDSYITGKNIRLEKPFKIIQEWRANEEHWPQNHFSILEITLSQQGNKTKMIFEQKGVPSPYAEDISNGWYEYYWNPIQAYFVD